MNAAMHLCNGFQLIGCAKTAQEILRHQQMAKPGGGKAQVTAAPYKGLACRQQLRAGGPAAPEPRRTEAAQKPGIGHPFPKLLGKFLLGAQLRALRQMTGGEIASGLAAGVWIHGR